MSIRTGIRCICVFFSLLLATVLAVPAHGHDDYDNMFKTGNTLWDCWDGTSTYGAYCQTDNATLTWYANATISAAGKQNIEDVLEDSFEATQLSVGLESPPVTSGLAETDIMFQSGETDGYLGITWCNDAVSTVRCDQHYVRFIGPGPGKKVACHEAGHAIGLTHGWQAWPAVTQGENTLGCMQTPDDQITSAVLGSHNSHQINATY